MSIKPELVPERRKSLEMFPKDACQLGKYEEMTADSGEEEENLLEPCEQVDVNGASS